MNFKIFNVAFVLAVFGLLSYLFISKSLHSHWYSQNYNFSEAVIIDVRRGESVRSVFEEMAEKGITQNNWLTRVCLRLYQPDFVMKAGEYVFRGQLSLADIFVQLGAGVSVQYPVTLVEGHTIAEVVAALNRESDQHQLRHVSIQQQQLAALLSGEARQMMPGEPHIEGWFFPDTYHFTRGDSLADVLARAHQRMLVVLREEWENRQPDLPYDSAYQALIMASLIEKETGAVDERDQIAGVFVRRLQKRMRLQTDPSVIYGMGAQYAGNLRRKDLKTDTPYNTYTRHGLPPTPIALPGRGAIHAALNPAAGTALYFVARGNGRHYFSDTLEEHLRAVREYQIENRRSDYRSSPGSTPDV